MLNYKKIAIMQPYFLPYIGYFQLINHCDHFVIFDDVNYINKGWINRNRILVNDQDKIFTIPLNKPSQNKVINETELSDNLKERKKIISTISHSYKKAPNFLEAFPVIENIILFSEKSLVSYIINSLKEICNYLEIEFNYTLSSQINKDLTLKGSKKIIEICKKLGAEEYINMSGGMELYKKEDFKQNKIDLKFLNADFVKYKQFKEEFVPSLSIIDVMMFNSKIKIKNFVNLYTIL